MKSGTIVLIISTNVKEYFSFLCEFSIMMFEGMQRNPMTDISADFLF